MLLIVDLYAIVHHSTAEVEVYVQQEQEVANVVYTWQCHVAASASAQCALPSR